METINIKELGDSFFNKDFENFIDKQPYMSFVILSAMLEFIGKVYCNIPPNQITNDSGDICYKVINNILSINKYTVFNDKKETKDGKKDINTLFTWLRCGMLHSLIPDGKLVLTDKENSLGERVVGAKELYQDLKNAWEEIKKKSDFKECIEKKALAMENSYSANTPTIIEQVVCLTHLEMKRVSFYADYCHEASGDENVLNLTGRYGFSIDCPDEIYEELYQVWDENGSDLNSWNTNWDGHDKLYHTINRIATKMLNKTLEEEKSGIGDISSLDVLWELSKETTDEFETRNQ